MKSISFMFFLAIISLNVFAVSDLQIRTVDDVDYCGGQLANQNLDPASLPDDGSVWRVGNKRWKPKDETDFSQWIKDNVTKDFFVDYDIVTDCADAASSLRAIFARINNLPVLFMGGLHSHATKKYANYRTVRDWSGDKWKVALRTDRRFRKAMYKWNYDSRTFNIQQDTYQVQVRSSEDSTRLSPYVTEGALLLTYGHTRIISEVDSLRWNPVVQMNSTWPPEVRSLNKGSMNIPYPSFKDKRSGRGILRWNWVVNCGGSYKHISDENMPGFSTEQMELDAIYNTTFPKLIQDLSRAKMLSEPKRKDILDMAETIKHMIDDRVPIVDDGYSEFLRNPELMQQHESGPYEAFSTPSRDEMILRRFSVLIDILNKFSGKIDVSEVDIAKMMLASEIKIDGVVRTNYYYFLLALSYKRASSEPYDEREDRWGMSYLRERLSVMEELKTGQVKKLADAEDYYKMLDRQQSSLERKRNKNAFWRDFFSFIPSWADYFDEYYQARVEDLKNKNVDLEKQNMLIQQINGMIETHKNEEALLKQLLAI